MDLAAWIVSGVLALVFMGAGGVKLSQSKAKLTANPQMAWAEDFNENTIKLIGGVEVLGAIGLILPWALGIAPVLTPLAAVGLAVTMVGAAATHLRRGEQQALPMNIVLFAMAAFVAYARFTA